MVSCHMITVYVTTNGFDNSMREIEAAFTDEQIAIDYILWRIQNGGPAVGWDIWTVEVDKEIEGFTGEVGDAWA